MSEDATREELMAYHHLLKSAFEQLQETRQQLDERKRAANASSLRRAQLSSTHYSSAHSRSVIATAPLSSESHA
jgi:hypothetical protein